MGKQGKGYSLEKSGSDDFSLFAICLILIH